MRLNTLYRLNLNAISKDDISYTLNDCYYFSSGDLINDLSEFARSYIPAEKGSAFKMDCEKVVSLLPFVFQ